MVTTNRRTSPSSKPAKTPAIKTTKRKTKKITETPATAPGRKNEWLVVDGDTVIYRGSSCGAAVALVRDRGLPSESLCQTKDLVADMLRDTLSDEAPVPAAKQPSVIPNGTGYRFIRCNRAGKIVAATAETYHIAEVSAVHDEFGLELLAPGADVSHLKTMKLPRNVVAWLDQWRADGAREDLQVTVYVVLTESNDVLTATASEKTAETYRDTYDKFHKQSGTPKKATIVMQTVGLHRERPNRIPVFVVRFDSGEVYTIETDADMARDALEVCRERHQNKGPAKIYRYELDLDGRHTLHE